MSMPLALTLLAQAAQSGDLDLTPIFVGVIAALSGSGMTAYLTVKRTNKKLEAEAELIYQQALELSDQRAAKNVETMERITSTLSVRLTATEEALEMAREKLAEYESRIRELSSRADVLAAEKDQAVMKAETERDRLQRRIAELEERYADLIAALPGKRRRDPHGKPPQPE